MRHAWLDPSTDVFMNNLACGTYGSGLDAAPEDAASNLRIR